jgi:hypothetical protein
VTTDLVLSLYRDRTDWVGPLRRPGVRVLVYDKWDGAEGSGRITPSLLRLPNVGKCDHTYLHHIIAHYHDLADWTVFAPDSAADGRLHGVRMEDALTPGDSLRVPRLWRGRDWGPDGRLRWAHFGGVPDRNGTNWADRYASGKITPAKLSFADWVRRYVGFDPDGPDWPGYAPGGIYAVPRRAITYLPAAFYARLRDQLSHAVEPEEGHYLERSWVVIFSGLARHQPEEAPVCVTG